MPLAGSTSSVSPRRILIYISPSANYNCLSSHLILISNRANVMNDSRPETLVELLKRSVGARPQKNALRFKQDKQWTSMIAERLLERVRNVTLGLYDLGVRKGDRVAMLAESGPMWTISDYAILDRKSTRLN